ncbi:hypothetical protein POSPLADRAFT_1064054 [Postia placenta MAD-698-R-SB12]|uniref:Sec39 domain-containing protein n=1 Tax=Postia placenta MAD-698-R-SB12 TaxID=670580 RepID=A0A1X6NFG0_9APHY|nr:hypothetical protein POSPLADRAFT_1064054 [Postia placenta MAD-698-R-SB12]OSX67379.1 hypothetical protein POSPLADRAFT_1064054 [Postia placenta MAD-698-R-SB12]
MPFLYGNHVLKAHLGRITEDTPEHQGVVVFSMNDIPLDICTQWLALSDADLTQDTIEQLLKPVTDDLWVAAACVDRILEDATVQRSIVELGIDRTESALTRCRDVYADTTHEAEDDDAAEQRNGDARQSEAQGWSASLLSHFRAQSADAQLCRIRSVLLDRLDRLNTYVAVCKEASIQPDADDLVDDEWEDDPWAEGSGEPSTSTSATSREPLIPLSTFLTTDLLHAACLLASLEQFTALRILMERHGTRLCPYRFLILDSVPEHALAVDFRDILPVYDPAEDREKTLETNPWRVEPDFSELPEPLPSSELVKWYQVRIDLIVSSTGMIDAAFSLVQHAASQGLPGLDEMGEELSLLSRLVYDTHPPPQGADDDWTLARWKAMDPSEIVRAYLAYSTSETIAQDISRLVMPYLFVLESRAERAGRPDPTLPKRLLYEYILNAPLELVATIFEASKPTLPPAQRLIRDDEDMARLALACLYGSDSLNEWPIMSRVFECLPAWDTAEDDEDADEADTTIASLGTFVAPSTSRPRCTSADLMLFFHPLPSSSLSRALDVLDVHLESGEILARWSVPAPLRWFLQSNRNIAEQRSWANRMARRAGGSQDRLDTQEDWEWLLEDMLKLSDEGDSGSWSAFCLLSKDDIIRIFFSGLLSTGKFDIAKNLLQSHNIHLSLDPRVIEDICLTCSQEFYDNATSGNYHFGDMKLAYDCLDIPPPSERIIKEKEFIEATSRLCSFNLMSRPGMPITPLEIRLTKDRLTLVSRVLSSNNDAYKHAQVILDLVNKLGFREDVVARVKTLAMLAETALQAEDFARAYETCENMIDTVHELRSPTQAATDPAVEEASEVCWVACFSLGRHPEFDDVQKKLILQGRALELCPPEKLVDILAIWHRIEEEDVQERRERLASTGHGPRASQTQRAGSSKDPVASLAARLQHLRMPDITNSPLVNHAPDAAAFANKAFSHVAANFPFSVGTRGRSLADDHDPWGSRETSRSRVDGVDVSAQASKVLQAGIGWLLGADDD